MARETGKSFEAMTGGLEGGRKRVEWSEDEVEDGRKADEVGVGLCGSLTNHSPQITLLFYALLDSPLLGFALLYFALLDDCPFESH